MSATFERYGSAAVRLLPTSLLALLAQAQRPVARYAAASKWRRYYGRQFVSAFDPEDDLMHYTMDYAANEHSSLRYYQGMRMYFEGGGGTAQRSRRCSATSASRWLTPARCSSSPAATDD